MLLGRFQQSLKQSDQLLDVRTTVSGAEDFRVASAGQQLPQSSLGAWAEDFVFLRGTEIHLSVGKALY